MDETVTIEETVTVDETVNIDKKTVTVEKSVFYNDLKVFCYELYNYVVARRYWYSDYPDPIVVTRESQFTEEVGKAVLVTWHHHRMIIKNMIRDDYPRFIGTPDNIERYVIIRTHDLMKNYAFETFFRTITEEFSFLKEFLLVTAISIEVYVSCYDFAEDSFLPYFVDFWCKLFMKQFYGRFEDYGWKCLREECLTLSRKYDLEQVEKYSEKLKVICLKGKYFVHDEATAALLGDKWRLKCATRFYTMKEDTNERVIDRDIKLTSMTCTLNKIDVRIQNPQEEG